MTHSVAHWQTQAAVKDRLMRPLRDLRISVIDRCNYRCPYCMPAELFGENHKFLPRAHWLTPGEIKRVASVFLQLGVKKLRLTLPVLEKPRRVVKKTSRKVVPKGYELAPEFRRKRHGKA